MTESQELTWGAAAVSTVGSITIEVDEALNADAWQLNVNAPRVYLSLPVGSVDELRRLKDFLRTAKGVVGSTEFSIGCDCVQLIKDDEYADRYFLSFLGQPNQRLRISLGQNEL